MDRNQLTSFETTVATTPTDREPKLPTHSTTSNEESVYDHVPTGAATTGHHGTTRVGQYSTGYRPSEKMTRIVWDHDPPTVGAYDPYSMAVPTASSLKLMEQNGHGSVRMTFGADDPFSEYIKMPLKSQRQQPGHGGPLTPTYDVLQGVEGPLELAGSSATEGFYNVLDRKKANVSMDVLVTQQILADSQAAAAAAASHQHAV